MNRLRCIDSQWSVHLLCWGWYGCHKQVLKILAWIRLTILKCLPLRFDIFLCDLSVWGNYWFTHYDSSAMIIVITLILKLIYFIAQFMVDTMSLAFLDSFISCLLIACQRFGASQSFKMNSSLLLSVENLLCCILSWIVYKAWRSLFFVILA